MVNDPRYDYSSIAASKVILRRGNKILFTREPLGHDWMPGRLGLPGGKYYLNEGMIVGTKRKIKEETGMKCELKGLFKIVQILMSNKTVYHYLFVADYVSGKIGEGDIYSAGLEWLSPGQVKKLELDETAEYYLPQVMEEYFSSPDKLIPLDAVLELRSFEDPEILKWMKKGTAI